MQIKSIRTYLQPFCLTRPYTIAYKTQDSVENMIVEIQLNNGILGFGAASPSEIVTGETIEMCQEALEQGNLDWLIGKDIKNLKDINNELLSKLQATPAARAAVDIALHDLYAQLLQQPLVEVLGRVHYELPTSITIGIKNVAETIIEGKEYVDRGFKILKVKLGHSLEEDIERLVKLRETFGNKIGIRVDPNQGYTLLDLNKFIKSVAELNIEFIEQPLKVGDDESLYSLSTADRKQLALDESILSPKDAEQALKPAANCGIFNIKLMKCGGIFSARQIAKIAHAAELDLMWGCMDESIISITAALHAAFACPATKYIDLDGSLDLETDIVSGGFILREGIMSVNEMPGLGIKKL